jgi:hypothetical protein
MVFLTYLKSMLSPKQEKEAQNKPFLRLIEEHSKSEGLTFVLILLRFEEHSELLSCAL